MVYIEETGSRFKSRIKEHEKGEGNRTTKLLYDRHCRRAIFV